MIILSIFFFITATLYSSVGFGGGSTYLALLLIWEFPYYIFPIIFCLGLSYVAITIRQLSSTEPVWLISFYFSLSITLLSFCSIPQGWVIPTLQDFFLLSLVGIFGGVANLWLSQSYKYSEVSLVTPLKYLALLFAIGFGYFLSLIHI